MIRGGGSMGMYYEAYLLDATQAALRRLNWDDATFVVSRSGVQQMEKGVKTVYRQYLSPPPEPLGRTWKERFAIWRYEEGSLRRVDEGDEIAADQ